MKSLPTIISLSAKLVAWIVYHVCAVRLHARAFSTKGSHMIGYIVDIVSFLLPHFLQHGRSLWSIMEGHNM